MWLYLFILSLRDIKNREITLGSVGLFASLVIINLFTRIGVPQTAEIVALSALFSGVFYAPLTYMKVLGMGDLLVEFIICMELIQSFPMILPIIMLTNFWFLGYTHFLKKTLPFIPVLSLVTLVSVSLLS